MNTNTRKIIHIDADSFYASVEIRENPTLSDKPVAVGGRPGSRGVIATCNYLAREFGVRSAMSSLTASKLCPDLIFLRPNFALYKQVSQEIRSIFERYTDQIEPLSLDEAYLDVTDSEHLNGSATRIAQAIRQSVKEELNLTVSAGVAPNKFLAKVASDWQKPDGLFVIKPSEVDVFVKDLPVRKINGVGKVTAKKLADMGVQTCGDLREFDLSELCDRFGKYGNQLFNYARGIDNRSIKTDRIRKSLSIEHTYNENITDENELKLKTEALYTDFLVRCEKLPSDTAITKRFVKIKFSDFTQTTLEESITRVERDWRNKEIFLQLMAQARLRSDKPIRLLGMGVKLRSAEKMDAFKQLPLF